MNLIQVNAPADPKVILLRRAKKERQRRMTSWCLPSSRTPKVVTAAPETSLQDVAMMMEINCIKRIPIVRNGELVGIVSRANLVQAVATAGTKLEIPVSDAIIREKLMCRLRSESWANASLLNATVNDGVVTLFGLTDSPTERQAIRVAAESTPGVVAVRDHIGIGRVAPI